MGEVVSIASQKGGVGKTFVTVNLATTLAVAGHKGLTDTAEKLL